MDIFSFFSADFWQTHALCLMFVSAFLSATVLPGNSEVVLLLQSLNCRWDLYLV